MQFDTCVHLQRSLLTYTDQQENSYLTNDSTQNLSQMARKKDLANFHCVSKPLRTNTIVDKVIEC